MKNLFVLLISLLICSFSIVAQIKVAALKGDVSVRHGASEQWQSVAVGDVLKPDDSMKMRKQSSATITLEDGKKIVVPEQVIVDVSDLRDLTQDEFLLKLAMEQVRSISLPEKEDNINIPRTSSMHGSQKGITGKLSSNAEVGVLQLNGTKVLFENGYDETGVLKTKQVFRLYPALVKQIETRMMVARAFENMNLTRDALGEYRSLLNEPLPPQQRTQLEQKIELLKKQVDG
ncbi:MAG: hypothetical protein HYZ33_00740 [Ignavibacteriales bacterium]|nr:hypothetical protein [Ignavibacteriales bacterium]